MLSSGGCIGGTIGLIDGGGMGAVASGGCPGNCPGIGLNWHASPMQGEGGVCPDAG